MKTISKFFWKHYKKIKKIVLILSDVFSILVIVLSLDSVYKTGNLKLIRPWQIARLIERFPRLFSMVKASFA